MKSSFLKTVAKIPPSSSTHFKAKTNCSGRILTSGVSNSRTRVVLIRDTVVKSIRPLTRLRNLISKLITALASARIPTIKFLRLRPSTKLTSSLSNTRFSTFRRSLPSVMTLSLTLPRARVSTTRVRPNLRKLFQTLSLC